MPLKWLRYVGLSHFEADECGALNAFLAAGPQAVPLCGAIAAMTSVGDFADRPPVVLADSQELKLGRHTVKWFDTPHVPHAWECGLMMESSTRTFFCGDLFTQGGPGEVALTETDILGPSEAFRKPMDYFAHAPQTREILERLAQEGPTTLACMHGSAWRGEGGALLRARLSSLSSRARSDRRALAAPVCPEHCAAGNADSPLRRNGPASRDIQCHVGRNTSGEFS